jgi:MFS family permease
VALSELVKAVRTSWVGKEQVDALLAGIVRPLAEEEDRRARADILISLLKSRYLRSMKGSAGVTVETVAMEAMQDLGYPYCNEIPDDVLGGRRSIPVVGMILALLLVLAPTVAVGPVGLLVAAPILMALLGGGLEIRALQTTGLVMMWTAGLILFPIGAYLIKQDAGNSNENFHGLGYALGGTAVGIAVLLMLSAFLMRHPAWRIPPQRPR